MTLLISMSETRLILGLLERIESVSDDVLRTLVSDPNPAISKLASREMYVRETRR